MISKFLPVIAIVTMGLLPGLQPARAQYAWPIEPLHASHEITGTFCEYRDTGSAPHFHNAVDIPKPDGQPVYAVADGRVTAMARSGYNAYVRVQNFAYVHIQPSPALSIGDSVYAGRTVIGTIYPGAAHVHFVDGYVGSERQPLRQNGGLTPYVDPWPPVIKTVRFLLGPTGQEFTGRRISGPVEITFRVREANGPPGTLDSRLNNGAYILGYQVLTSSRDSVVYSPSDDGVQFRFDLKPSNSYVHNVFDPNQSTTSSHVYRITSRVNRRTFWDTRELPPGDYTVMLFAGDTRDNFDTVYVDVTITQQDLLPPAQPVFLAALTRQPLEFLWQPGGNDPDLAGFRIYISPDNVSWSIWRDETRLGPSLTRTTTTSVLPSPRYFYITAADSASPPNESERSDVYGIAPDHHGKRILIVDGFDRTQSSGSWHQPWHDFAYVHGEAIAAGGFGFSTCANEMVAAGQIDLRDYDAVIWLLGDESTADETFSAAEQAKVRAYLEAGGRLFVTGSEIAWDLGAKGSASDRQFLRQYLKVDYSGDDSESYTVTGTAEGIFAGLQFGYGSAPYPEDWPDYFTPAEGGTVALQYANGRVAGIQYAGPFGGDSTTGKLVVIGFPFETITGADARAEIMQRVLRFFFPEVTGIAAPEPSSGTPQTFRLEANFPNPLPLSGSAASRGTTFPMILAEPARVELAVYDVLGRRVRTWSVREWAAGKQAVRWDGRNDRGIPVAPGVYFFRMQARPIRNPAQVYTLQRKLLVK